MLLPPLLLKSIECKSKAVMQNPAPHGMARHGTASSISPPPYLLLRWRNTRSLLLQPILFCIFGMCSQRDRERRPLHGVEHVVETTGRPVFAKARRLDADKLRIAEAELDTESTFKRYFPTFNRAIAGVKNRLKK